VSANGARLKAGAPSPDAATPDVAAVPGQRAGARVAARHSVARAGRRAWPTAGAAVRSIWRLWFFAALIALWWLLSAGSTSPYFPPLSDIVHRLVDLWITGEAKRELVPSLEHFAIGYLLAGAIGVVGGALLWRFRRVDNAISPLLYFIYVIPAAAVLPAIVAVMGIGAQMKVTVIVLAALWPALLNTVDGMRGVDPVQLDTAQVLHMSPLRTVRSVVLPAALPQIMAGLRNSLQIAIIMMVVSELIASTSGIGFFILDAQQRFAITDMWTGIIVLAIIGSALTLVFVAVERVVLGWYIGARAVEGKR
jgi:ABC-type nitrate/sulfonate/bicarbonate transport system permease component